MSGSVTVNNQTHLVLRRVGIFPIIIALAYLASCVLLVGALLLILLNDSFFSLDGEKVNYLSDALILNIGWSILCFGTSYCILWGTCLLVCWILEDIVLFIISLFNLIAFNGVLAYTDLNGPEHVVFVILLLVTHSVFQHIVSNSQPAKDFPQYRILTSFTVVILVVFIALWFVGEKVVRERQIQIAAVAFEIVLWCTASLEFVCM
eukprot:3864310-Rhodomonas_salina.1